MQATISEHKFNSLTDAKEFALAGNAILTLESLRTGNHFTYKIKAKDVAGPIRADYKPGQIHFVSLLAQGNADEGQFVYLGMINSSGEFFATKASRDQEASPSFKAFRFFWNSAELHCELVVRHEGHCGRCGRTLTHPESIDLGIGPECAKRM